MGLVACHYEIGLGELPKVERCTAMAVGPPDTGDGNTYVGQSHDYLTRWYGRSSMLLWQRAEGPSVLSMHYPGQWIWCGMNSAGIGLCGTAAEVSKKEVPGPAIGIPWYVLAAQILYQDTLSAAIEEARRAKQAGWSTLVLSNGEGDLANLEYTPKKMVVETTRGHMARVDFGSRGMLGFTDAQPRCVRMYELLGMPKAASTVPNSSSSTAITKTLPTFLSNGPGSGSPRVPSVSTSRARALST